MSLRSSPQEIQARVSFAQGKYPGPGTFCQSGSQLPRKAAEAGRREGGRGEHVGAASIGALCTAVCPAPQKAAASLGKTKLKKAVPDPSVAIHTGTWALLLPTAVCWPFHTLAQNGLNPLYEQKTALGVGGLTTQGPELHQTLTRCQHLRLPAQLAEEPGDAPHGR